MPTHLSALTDTPEQVVARRLPLGLGLSIAMVTSGGLWMLLISAARSLF